LPAKPAILSAARAARSSAAQAAPASAAKAARASALQAVNPFFTIGHSTRPIDEFVSLLAESAVRLVVDVRTVPRSRTNPQYNKDTLPATLAAADVAYVHLAALGGLRGHDASIPAGVNGFWDNASFHNYADYALGTMFAAGLQALRDAGHAQRCAIMCSEAVWWRCHRRIVSDYLLARDEKVFHIMGRGKVVAAELNPAAHHQGEALVYPPAPQA
jgi:uncharacterized protein (DUF488 family)